MKIQNYANHRRFVYSYHIFTFLLVMLLLVSSAYYTISSLSKGVPAKDWMFLLLISIVLFSVFFFSRLFALKAQDRAIRAEENFRHFILTGKPLDSKLTIRQIIGLRFASDEEFPELAKSAVEKGMSEDEIKKAVKNWRGDYYRV